MKNGTTNWDSEEKPLEDFKLSVINGTKIWSVSPKGDRVEYNISSTASDELSLRLNRNLYSRVFRNLLIHISAEEGWETVFERVGVFITEFLRSSENPSARELHGKAFATQATFEVRWAWLILPISVVLLSISFLIATILQSRGKPYIFKNSFLPAIFYGLDKECVGKIEKRDRRRLTDGDLMKRAAQIEFTLVKESA